MKYTTSSIIIYLFPKTSPTWLVLYRTSRCFFSKLISLYVGIKRHQFRIRQLTLWNNFLIFWYFLERGHPNVMASKKSSGFNINNSITVFIFTLYPPLLHFQFSSTPLSFYVLIQSEFYDYVGNLEFSWKFNQIKQ